MALSHLHTVRFPSGSVMGVWRSRGTGALAVARVLYAKAAGVFFVELFVRGPDPEVLYQRSCRYPIAEVARMVSAPSASAVVESPESFLEPMLGRGMAAARRIDWRPIENAFHVADVERIVALDYVDSSWV